MWLGRVSAQYSDMGFGGRLTIDIVGGRHLIFSKQFNFVKQLKIALASAQNYVVH